MTKTSKITVVPGGESLDDNAICDDSMISHISILRDYLSITGSSLGLAECS